MYVDSGVNIPESLRRAWEDLDSLCPGEKIICDGEVFMKMSNSDMHHIFGAFISLKTGTWTHFTMFNEDWMKYYD